MLDFKQALLLLLLCIGSCKKACALQLFDIPFFTVHIAVEPFLDNASDAYQLLQFSNLLKTATNAHLFAYFESMLDQHGNLDGAASALNSIDLDVAVHNEFEGEEIRADMIGQVTFSEARLAVAGFLMNQSVVNDMVNQAFKGTDEKDDFLARLQVLLPDVAGVTVQTKSSEENPTVTINGKDTPGIESGTSALVVSMALALIAVVAGTFVYFRKDKHNQKRGHLLMNVEQYSDYSEEDGSGPRTFSGELQLDESSYESYDAEDGIQFIPVPARIDETAKIKNVTQRRFVQPGSPFELLYGAAFSHRDQAKVAKAHGTKQSKPQKSMKVAGKRIRKRDPLQPMLPITEVNEEDTKMPTNESFFPQFMSSISFFLKDKTSISDREECAEIKDQGLVYRDFPRHDGTPCVMFTALDDVEWKENPHASLVCNNEEIELSCLHRRLLIAFFPVHSFRLLPRTLISSSFVHPQSQSAIHQSRTNKLTVS